MNNKFGTLGTAIGGLALILALVHFLAGPFAKKAISENELTPPLETMPQKALGSIAAKPRATEAQGDNLSFNLDQLLQLVATLCAGIAFALALISHRQQESKYLSRGAGALALSASAFQFMTFYAVTILIVLVIVFVLSNLNDHF